MSNIDVIGMSDCNISFVFHSSVVMAGYFGRMIHSAAYEKQELY